MVVSTHRKALRELWIHERATCAICERKVPWVEASVDHATPLSRGGFDTPRNRKLAHTVCNHWKADRTLRETRGACCDLDTRRELVEIRVRLFWAEYDALRRSFAEQDADGAGRRAVLSFLNMIERAAS
jgi:hypothetical protein